MMNFLWMGGYYPFVWPAYAVTFIVIGLNIYWAKRLLARARQAARRRVEVQIDMQEEPA
jgi:heme exporter protein CcmD